MTNSSDDLEAVTSQHEKTRVMRNECEDGVSNPGFMDTVHNEITSLHDVNDVINQRGHELIRGTRVTESEKSHTKSGHGVILMGACFSLFIAVGYPISMGVLYVEWLDEFHSSRGETALIQSIYSAITFGAGLVVGVFIQRFGSWLTFLLGSLSIILGLFASWFATSPPFLIVSAGIVSGAGGCMIYMSITVIVCLTFKKTRNIAMTTMIGAGGLGATILPKLQEYFVDELGWRGSLLILSGIASNLIIFATILKTGFVQSFSDTNRSDSSAHTSFVTQCRSSLHPIVCIVLLGIGISLGLGNSVANAVVDFAETVGHHRHDGVILLLCFSICQTIASILTGFMKLMPCSRSILLLVLGMSLVSGFYIALPFFTGYAGKVVCYAFMGMGHGSVAAIRPVLIFELTGEKTFPLSLGISSFCNGIFGAILGTLMGILVDTMGSYERTFQFYGAVGGFMTLFISVSFLIQQFANSRQNKTETKSTVEIECISTTEAEYCSNTRLLRMIRKC